MTKDIHTDVCRGKGDLMAEDHVTLTVPTGGRVNPEAVACFQAVYLCWFWLGQGSFSPQQLVSGCVWVCAELSSRADGTERFSALAELTQS